MLNRVMLVTNNGKGKRILQNVWKQKKKGFAGDLFTLWCSNLPLGTYFYYTGFYLRISVLLLKDT